MKYNITRVLMVVLLFFLMILVFLLGYEKIEKRIYAKGHDIASTQEILPTPYTPSVRDVYIKSSVIIPIEYDYGYEYEGNIKGSSLFFGDSLTEGLLVFGYFKESIHMGINALDLEKAITHVDELASHDPSKIFILMGTNDMWCGESVDVFSKKYRLLVKEIRCKCPGSKIYLESIFPVSKHAIERNTLVDNNKINRANLEIMDIARDYGLVYLDINSKMKNAEGYLYPEYTEDGVHIINKYYHIWTDILKKYVT